MKNLEKKPLIVAIVRKGGVGKTVVTTLITKALSMY
jgi:CO dehydrogenase nickel-insertion accessory protein CooC1